MSYFKNIYLSKKREQSYYSKKEENTPQNHLKDFIPFSFYDELSTSKFLLEGSQNQDRTKNKFPCLTTSWIGSNVIKGSWNPEQVMAFDSRGNSPKYNLLSKGNNDNNLNSAFRQFFNPRYMWNKEDLRAEFANSSSVSNIKYDLFNTQQHIEIKSLDELKINKQEDKTEAFSFEKYKTLPQARRQGRKRVQNKPKTKVIRAKKSCKKNMNEKATTQINPKMVGIKIIKPPIFRIRKIYNRECWNTNRIQSNKHWFNFCSRTNAYQISLKYIKQWFHSNCIIILNYHNECLEKQNQTLTLESDEMSIQDKVITLFKNKIIATIPFNVRKQLKRNMNKNKEHYWMFTPEAKKFCLELIKNEKLSLEIVAKMCNIPYKSLRRWTVFGYNRKKGCGRKIFDPEMEEKVLEWVNKSIESGKYPTGKMIRMKALELTQYKGFWASKGWWEKFKKKFNVKIWAMKETVKKNP